MPTPIFLETISPVDALLWGERLSTRADIVAAYPVESKPFKPRKAYASVPDDPFFDYQWYLDQRDAKGQKLGLDLNLRAAWPVSGGNGVGVAIVDTGVGLLHPDLEEAFSASENHNFISGEDDGEPVSSSMFHGTAVAGLIGAVHDNQEGIAGILPGASLSSWVIFGLGVVLLTHCNLPKCMSIGRKGLPFKTIVGAMPSLSKRDPPSSKGLPSAMPSTKGDLVREPSWCEQEVMTAFEETFILDWVMSMMTVILRCINPSLWRQPIGKERPLPIPIEVPASWSQHPEVSDDGLFTTDLLGRQGYTTSTRGLGEGDYIPNEIGFIGHECCGSIGFRDGGAGAGGEPQSK